jgi:hypothetical protein
MKCIVYVVQIENYFRLGYMGQSKLTALVSNLIICLEELKGASKILSQWPVLVSDNEYIL